MFLARFRLLSFVAILSLPCPGRGQPAAPAAVRPPADVLDRVEGNWEVTSTDSRTPGETKVTIVALWKARQLLNNGVPMSPWDSFSSVAGSNWRWQRLDDSDWVEPNRNALSYSADGSFALKGYGNRVSTFRPAGGDVMHGRWKDGPAGGEETWRRLVPRITAVEYVGLTTDRVALGERPGRLRVNYEAANGSRGNKRSFFIRIMGENLGGYHNAWVEGTDVEAYSISILRTTKAGETYGEIQDFGGQDPITGRFMEGYVWSRVTPGIKRLHFDNITVPFQLSLEGFPKPAVELRFMRHVNDRFMVAPELYEGDEFYIEATFATVPAQPPGRVKVNWSESDVREVVLVATSDPKLYRSGPLHVESPAKSTP